MNYEMILTEMRGNVGLITLNRPKAMNALNNQLMREMMDALGAFDGEPGIGAMVLTGNEKAFAAGEITQDDLNLWTGPENSDYFGYVLAAGNFDHPSAALSDPRVAVDLAIGVPDENLVGIASGVMLLVFGSVSGFQGAWTLPFPGFAIEFGEANDRFASSLAAGDFDGDGAGDLAVGIIGRDVPGADNAGAVQILFGALFASGFENGDFCLWSAPGCV